MNKVYYFQSFTHTLIGLLLFNVALSAIALEPVGSGSNAASDGNIIAITAQESYDNQDRNGDGDTRDRILTIHNITDSNTINTGIPVVGQLATDGATVVFLYSERNDYIDLNGDNDTRDNLLAYYNIATGEVKTTTIEPWLSGPFPNYDVDGNYIVFISKESLVNEDYNGDGDQLDTVVRYFDIHHQQVVNTPLTAPYAMVDDGVIATRVIESGSADVNQDGDTNDIVFVSYDIESGDTTPYLATSSFNLSNIASFPAKHEENYYFRARENQLGFDVDGNNSISSGSVLMHYDMANQTLNWTGVAGTTGRIQAQGSYISYETSEWIVGEDINNDGNLRDDFLYAVHNLSDGAIQYFEKTGTLSLGYGVFSQTIYEGSRGDLNNDGDARDTIVYAQAIDQSESIDIENCAQDDIHCRFLNLQDYLSNHSGLNSSAKSHLIQLVIDSDTIFTQNQFDNDMARYIDVIASFDLYFDSIWPRTDISQEIKLELVEQHPNGRSLKDHLHTLKDAAAEQLDNQSGNNGQADGNNAQILLAHIATAIQSSNAPQSSKAAMMAELSGIMLAAQQIMGGADPSVLIGDVIAHIQTMSGVLNDANYGFSSEEAANISLAIDAFQSMLSGGSQ